MAMHDFGDILWADSSVVWLSTASQALKETELAIEQGKLSPAVLLTTSGHNVVPATNPGESLNRVSHEPKIHSHVHGALRVSQ